SRLGPYRSSRRSASPWVRPRVRSVSSSAMACCALYVCHAPIVCSLTSWIFPISGCEYSRGPVRLWGSRAGPSHFRQTPRQAAEEGVVAGPLRRQAAHEAGIGGAARPVEAAHHGADVLLHAGVAGVLGGHGGGVGRLQ